MSFADLIQQGTSHAWLFIPSAILLGALHGLEPGHSKTMMAAFIVAIRGTIGQAVMLGLAATVSHTAVVWGIALGGMYLWRGLDAEVLEPYLQLISAVIIIGIALWMLRRTWKERQEAKAEGHHHHHPQHSQAEVHHIDTGHGSVTLQIFEAGVPPRWRFASEKGAHWAAGDVVVETERLDGSRQSFAFVDKGGYLESSDEIAEPHQFMARLTLSHGSHAHDYDLSYIKGAGHDHIHEEVEGLKIATGGFQDAHELAHANDIRRRFSNQNVTNGQILLFGLTGGLIPCPASVTVLLLCLQLKQFTLGAVLVLCFSIGLAVTLVTVGVAAAWSVRHVGKRSSWLSSMATRAPYFSSVLIICVGLYVGVQGWLALGHVPVLNG